MSLKSILLACAAVAIAAPALAQTAKAQTAKDYARYDSYVAPKAQGQRVGGLRVFMLGGLKSHGPGAHDYPFWMDKWSKLLTAHGAVVDGSFSFPSPEQLARTDVMVIYR